MTAASASAAFNLICMIHGVYFDHRLQSYKDFPIEFRIDLAENRFCTGMCDETNPIAKATSTDLLLVSSRDADGHNINFVEISRESGSYVSILGEPPGETRMLGSCEKRPFAGFPKPKF